MATLFTVLAVVTFLLGVALLVTSDPSNKLLAEILFLGLTFFAARFLPWAVIGFRE